MRQYTCYFNQRDALLNIVKALVEVPEYVSKMSQVILITMTKCLLPSKKRQNILSLYIEVKEGKHGAVFREENNTSTRKGIFLVNLTGSHGLKLQYERFCSNSRIIF